MGMFHEAFKDSGPSPWKYVRGAAPDMDFDTREALRVLGEFEDLVLELRTDYEVPELRVEARTFPYYSECPKLIRAAFLQYDDSCWHVPEEARLYTIATDTSVELVSGGKTLLYVAMFRNEEGKRVAGLVICPNNKKGSPEFSEVVCVVGDD